MCNPDIPEYWTPEQALAVFEWLDALRDAVWERYGLEIQQACRNDRDDGSNTAQIDWLQELDGVPF